MPPPRPPSCIEPLTFPVFGMSWFGDPSDGRSLLAMAGGGGSAATGVLNSIVVQDGSKPPIKISTGAQIGVALHVYKNPISNALWLVVALGTGVQRYTMPDGRDAGCLVVIANDSTDNPYDDNNKDEKKKKGPSDMCNSLTVNAMADRLAVGCDSGLIKVYGTSDDRPFSDAPLYLCQGHSKAVCALQFSLRQGLLLSSAKDGTVRVWKESRSVSELQCDCTDPTSPRNNTGQTLVRGCAFLDIKGLCAVTVASKRRGKAFLSQWVRQPQAPSYELAMRTVCSPCPISAMSLSQDGELLTLGSVDGSIILWSIPEWRALKTFPEVHDLPVTCIAARPFPVPLQGEEETGVAIHARSASADSKMGLLTLQRRAPKRNGNDSGKRGVSIGLWIHKFIQTGALVLILWPIGRDAMDKCSDPWKAKNLGALQKCFVQDVLIAPSERPGISIPPY